MADIEEIKSKLDIVDVIASYVPELKKAGANYKACCPFHLEKSPSFTVNPSLQIFKCFGCGKAGDVIKFIEEIERVEFAEALKISAEKAGVELSNNISPANQKEKKDKENLLRANSLTAKFYNFILLQHKSGKKGLEYATKKRLIDIERIKEFVVGYAPAQPTNLKNFLISKGFLESDLLKWGLLVERNGKTIDKFRDRLIQPIFNLKGEVVAFSGRYLGSAKEAPKYLNSPETPVYKKNEMLYGLYQAKDYLKENNFLIIVEGNIDILSSHRVGIGNIIAPLGTAFTNNQAKLIKRFSEYVYFCFDTDTAGRKALIRGLGIAEEIELKHKVIDITGFQDADDLIKADPNLWLEKIKEAQQTMDYLINIFTRDQDMGSAEGKTNFEYNILPCLALLKDEVLFNHYRKAIASILEVSEEYIDNKARKGQLKPSKSLQLEESTTFTTTERKINIDSKEKLLLEYLIALDKFDTLSFEPENFLTDVAQLYELFLQNTNVGFEVIEEKVPLELKKIFEEIVINGQSIEVNDNTIKETNRLAAMVRKSFLRSPKNNKRALDPEDPEYIKIYDQKRNELKFIESGEYKIV